MIVFHGTGGYALESLLKGPPHKRARPYLRKPSFSTTLAFRTAALFALRKSSAEDLRTGRISGVVVEYRLDGAEGKDFRRTRDPYCLQEEHEVAVFSVKLLVPLAVWRDFRGEWERKEV